MMILSALNKYAGILFLLGYFAFPSFAQSPEKMTVLKFNITERSIADDSLFLKRMRSDITSRLLADTAADLQVRVANIQLDNDQLIVSLHGNTVMPLTIRRLTRAANLSFYSGYADAPGMIRQLRQKSPESLFYFPSDQVKSHTYLSSFLTKDATAVKKILQQIGQPAGYTWYYHPIKDHLVELYLLHTAAPVISNNEIMEVSQYEEQWSAPETGGAAERQMQCVMIVLNQSGTTKFAAFTRTHLNQMITVVAGNEIITAPIINGEITAGKLTINSGYDPAVTKAIIHKIGYPFPCKLMLLSSKVE